MTCLKLSLLSLVEYAMQEYFGGTAIHWRIFIEHLVALAVTGRSTKRVCLFEVRANL